MRGKIKKVFYDKKCGFIQADDGQKVFFYFSEIKFKGVRSGTKVEFTYGKNKKGSIAKNISKQIRENTSHWDNIVNLIENYKMDEQSKKNMLRNLSKFREQELHVLIAGATGAGKSSTINALFDMNVAEVGYGVDPFTKTIGVWNLDDNLFLHDTPGLGDGAQQDLIYKEMIKRELRKKIQMEAQ